MDDELKPCPFCGGKVSEWEDYDNSWYVECNCCGVKVIQPTDTKDEVDKWWNRRAVNEQ